MSKDSFNESDKEALVHRKDQVMDQAVDQVMEQAITTMSHWVAAIADNIKNPVAGIAAALDVLSHQIVNQTGKTTLAHATLDRIRVRLSSLNEYLTELTEFSRPLTIYPGDIKTKDLFLQVQSLAQTKFPFAIDWEMAWDPKIKSVVADEHRLIQALKAIVFNGVEAACLILKQDVKPKIAMILCKTHTDHQDFLEFVIEDNGPGFSDELSSHVIRPFFSTKEAGTGLGLFLAQKYIAAHRGSLHIGRGKTLAGGQVTLRIPFNLPSSSEV